MHDILRREDGTKIMCLRKQSPTAVQEQEVHRIETPEFLGSDCSSVTAEPLVPLGKSTHQSNISPVEP